MISLSGLSRFELRKIAAQRVTLVAIPNWSLRVSPDVSLPSSKSSRAPSRKSHSLLSLSGSSHSGGYSCSCRCRFRSSESSRSWFCMGLYLLQLIYHCYKTPEVAQRRKQAFISKAKKCSINFASFISN